jgi:hypothetical protein
MTATDRYVALRTKHHYDRYDRYALKGVSVAVSRVVVCGPTATGPPAEHRHPGIDDLKIDHGAHRVIADSKTLQERDRRQTFGDVRRLLQLRNAANSAR